MRFCSKNHIVLIQDVTHHVTQLRRLLELLMRNPSSQFSKTHNTFCNPQHQKSENGLPFNLKEMLGSTSKHDVKQVKIPLGHASVDIVEMVMKSLGKPKKIGDMQNKRTKKKKKIF